MSLQLSSDEKLWKETRLHSSTSDKTLKKNVKKMKWDLKKKITIMSVELIS